VTRLQTEGNYFAPELTKEGLAKKKKKYQASKYNLAKWLNFCEVMHSNGFKTYVYEAKRTVSKYIYVVKEKKRFKVRFSNHKPSKKSEFIMDCDFFVGVTRRRTTNTTDAIFATLKFFRGESNG